METRTILMSHTGTPPGFRHLDDERRFTAPPHEPTYRRVPSYKVKQVYRATCNICGLVCEASDESVVNRQMQLHCQSHAPAESRPIEPRDLLPKVTSP